MTNVTLLEEAVRKCEAALARAIAQGASAHAIAWHRAELAKAQAALAAAGEIQIASRDALLTALAAAKGGERLRLAPRPYGDLVFERPVPVTLIGGQFGQITLRGVTTLTFEDTVAAKLTTVAHWQRGRSRGLTIRRGRYAQIAIRGVDGLLIEDAEICHGPEANLSIGLSLMDLTNGIVRRCDIHHMAHDNIVISGDVNRLEVSDCDVHHSVAPFGSGRHVDCLQIHGLGADGSGVAPRNVTILRNLFFAGTPAVMDPAQMQGFMINDPRSPKGFENLEIAGNFLSLRNANCIDVSGAPGARIHHNTIMPSLVPNRMPFLRVHAERRTIVVPSTGASVLANLVPSIITADGAEQTANLTYGWRTDLFGGDGSLRAHYKPLAARNIPAGIGAVVP